jgi:hypothetical protein
MASVFYNIGKVYKDIQGRWAERVYIEDRRTSSIVKNPLDYEVAVIRANVPLTTIPLMRIKADTKYKITFSLLEPDDETYLTVESDPLDREYHIYNYDELAFVMQKIIDSAWVKFIAEPLVLAAAITNDMKPKLVYNALTGLYSIKMNKVYFADLTEPNIGPDQLARVKFTMNDSMFLLFSFPSIQQLSFKVGSYGRKEWDIALYLGRFNEDDDPDDPAELEQSFDTRKSIDQLDKIIIATSKLPVRAELLGTGENQKGGNTRRILAEIDAGGLTFGHFTYLNFFPEGPLNWHTLITDTSILDMDITIYWTSTIDDELNTLYAPINSSVDVKLEFKPITQF